MIDHVSEAVTSVFVLSRCDGNGGCASDFTLSDVVVWFDGFFKPEEVVFFGFSSEFDGLIVTVRVIGVDHQPYVGSNGLPADADAFDVFVD